MKNLSRRARLAQFIAGNSWTVISKDDHETLKNYQTYWQRFAPQIRAWLSYLTSVQKTSSWYHDLSYECVRMYRDIRDAWMGYPWR